MRFVTVIGARPQFIKAAPLSKVLREGHEEFLLHTGQHYDDNMSDVFFRELEIPLPNRQLGIGSGSHGAQTGAMLDGIEGVLLEVRPDAVIVFGDTNSTLAGALAAAKLNIPVAHVEAGLRSFDRRMPEEVNRVVTDHLSRWLFAPSETACGQLAYEGLRDGVHCVGDIMADSVRHFSPVAQRTSDILRRLGLTRRSFGVATMHRAVNTDDPVRLAGILEALQSISQTWKHVVLPLHPRTRAAVARYKLQHMLGNRREEWEWTVPGHRTNRLPRHAGIAAELGRSPYRFGRGAKGGLLSKCTVYYPP